jgi:hypothetical protein
MASDCNAEGKIALITNLPGVGAMLLTTINNGALIPRDTSL